MGFSDWFLIVQSFDTDAKLVGTACNRLLCNELMASFATALPMIWPFSPILPGVVQLLIARRNCFCY